MNIRSTLVILMILGLGPVAGNAVAADSLACPPTDPSCRVTVADTSDDADPRVDRALDALLTAAQSGHAAARDKLADFAQRDVPGAQFRLGLLLYTPQPESGVAKSLPDALAWWLKASELGHGQASMAVANIYDHGEGPVAVDHARALRYYERAVAQGWANPTSYTRLARGLLRTGNASQCSRILALLTEAANAGFSEATRVLSEDSSLRALCGS